MRAMAHKGLGAAFLLLSLLAAAGAWWLVSPGVAGAHSNMASAEPAPNSELVAAPERIIIWFTQPIEPSLSEIRVLDAGGRQVDAGDSVVDDLNPQAMWVGLGEVPDGTYTVAWKNVSAVDGHLVRGSFVFAVGQPLGAAAPAPEQPLLQSPWEPLLRWLALLGTLTMMGGLALELLVTRPALLGRGASAAVRAAGGLLEVRADRVAWASFGVFAAASAAQLLVQTTVTYEVSLWGAFGLLGDALPGTGWGRAWLLRMGAGVAFGVALFSLRWVSGSRGGTAVRAAALVLGVAVLWGWAMGSHGAATGDISEMALAADFLHLAASAFWIGALFHFFLGLSALRGLSAGERRECLTGILPRFSVVASLSVAVIIVTGVFSGWAQVTVVDALTTPYGVTLIAKVGLVLPLLLLGGINLVWVSPRLRRESADSAPGAAGSGAEGWLKRLLLGEAVLAVLVLGAVGMLTSLEPARLAASRELAETGQALSFSDTVDGDNIGLEVSPGRVGANDVIVRLTDRLGRPIVNADEVSVRLVYLDSSIGDDVFTAAPAGDGVYVGERAQMSIGGAWQAELVVRRPDAFDARTAFRFEIAGGGGSGAAFSPSPETGYLLLGAGLLTLGLMFVGFGLPLGGWFSRPGAGVMTPGVIGAAVGLLLLFNAPLGLGGGGDTLRNPFPPTPESLGLGAGDYGQVCQTCHGVGGRGDGPGGAGLEPPPADLVVHVPLHADEDLFQFIRDGIPGTGMAPQGEALGEDRIWHLVNYIRTLE